MDKVKYWFKLRPLKVKVDQPKYEKIVKTYTIAFVVFIFSTIISVLYALFITQKKIELGEIPSLETLTTVLLIILTAYMMFINLTNAMILALNNKKTSKLVVFMLNLGSLILAGYLNGYTINDVYTASYYNDEVENKICKVYTTDNKKSDFCLNYLESKEKSEELTSKFIYFYNFEERKFSLRWID